MKPAANWRIGLTLVLLLAALASGWSVWQQSGLAETGTRRVRSDYVLHDFEIVSLGKDGKEAFTLRGPRLQRDPGAESMTLETPQFLVPDPAGGYWDVRARVGTVPEAGEELRLRGQVVAVSPPEAPPSTRIETEQLDLFPGENRMASAVVVTITRPGLTMRGRGLEADFERNQATLLSDVHSRYVPNR